MRRFNQPVEVLTNQFWPAEIRTGGQAYRVHEILDHWIVQSRWLTGGKERIYYRIRTHRGTLDICNTEGRWVLCKVFD